ncbi:MAG: acyltransferase, partial [Acidobacteriota bacterium]|nr:acyltransferase [Acidobacteriota bacterium]
ASPAAKRLLNKRIPSFLGRISYSLYLIHIPVLFSLVFTLHHKVGKSSMFMLYLPLSLALATAFHFAVELPCTSLGQLVGRTRRQTANVYAR